MPALGSPHTDRVPQLPGPASRAGLHRTHPPSKLSGHSHFTGFSETETVAGERQAPDLAGAWGPGGPLTVLRIRQWPRDVAGVEAAAEPPLGWPRGQAPSPGPAACAPQPWTPGPAPAGSVNAQAPETPAPHSPAARPPGAATWKQRRSSGSARAYGLGGVVAGPRPAPPPRHALRSVSTPAPDPAAVPLGPAPHLRRGKTNLRSLGPGPSLRPACPEAQSPPPGGGRLSTHTCTPLLCKAKVPEREAAHRTSALVPSLRDPGLHP